MSLSRSFLDADLIQCALARYYERRFGNSFVCIGNFPGFDIKFSNGTTVEVKCDEAGTRTHNAAVEYWDSRRDRASGILETTASLWIHCVPEGEALRCYEILTKKLLKLCIEAGELKTGGDFDSSCMKIIPLQKLREISNQDFLLVLEKQRLSVEAT